MWRLQSTEHCTNITAVLAVIFAVLLGSVIMTKCSKIPAFSSKKKKNI